MSIFVNELVIVVEDLSKLITRTEMLNKAVDTFFPSWESNVWLKRLSCFEAIHVFSFNSDVENPIIFNVVRRLHSIVF